jgi:DNA-binding NtrC family response regulator
MPRRQSSAGRNLTALADSSSAVFLVGERRHFRLFNHGCELETGWTAAEIADHRCDYLTESDPQTVTAVAAALAPPPQSWQGEIVSTPVDLPHRTEPPRPRLVHFFPLADDEQRVIAVLGIITPVPSPAGPGVPSMVETLHAELASLRHELRRRFGERTLLARSPAMLRVLRQIQLAQAGTTPMLLVGEAGSGREHIARTIHYGGPRGRQSFVPFDCATVDALELKRSLRHLAEGGADGPLAPGTLYLANLDTAPAEVVSRVAAFVSSDSALRIIGTSQQRLDALVDEQRFPQELYFRLTSLVIDVPPLRERRDDLGPLAQLFLEELNRDAEQQVSGFHEDVWEQFRRYHWPGNLDELRSVVVEARHACSGPLILPEHLPFRFRTGVDAQKVAPRQRPQPVLLDALLERVEKEQLELALSEARGNITQAAELLGIPRARFYRRMQQLGMTSDNREASPSRDEPDA